QQRAHRVPAIMRVERARRRADPSLELVAHHSRAPAHAALDDGTAAGTVHRGPGILLRDVKAVDVVELAVPRLRHHRQRPYVAVHASPTDHPFDHRIAHDADRMRDPSGTQDRKSTRLNSSHVSISY